MQGHTMKSSTLVRRFLPYYKKYGKTVAIDLFCAALTTVCELVLPLIVSAITDRATTDIASLTTSFVLKLGGVYLVLRLIDAAANYYMASIGHIMGSYIETDMRTELFAHLQQLSFSYYSETKVGQIMSRMTSDLFEVTEFAHHCPEEFFIAGIKILVSFVILCGMNIPLTLMMFAVLPLMLVTTRYFNKRMRYVFKERNKQAGEINAQVEDSLLGIRVVKSFANEEIEERKFDEGNQKFLKLKKMSYECMAAFSTSNRIFDGVMYIVVVVAGALHNQGRTPHRLGIHGLPALCQHAADLHPADCGVYRAVPAGHDGHRALLRNHGRAPGDQGQARRQGPGPGAGRRHL